MNPRNFFAELKRRNVLRAAAFYAASVWLLVQVATQVFPFFHIAEWVVRWIVVASAIGFPFAILFSWFHHDMKLPKDAVGIGEHTRPRVFRLAPSPVGKKRSRFTKR